MLIKAEGRTIMAFSRGSPSTCNRQVHTLHGRNGLVDILVADLLDERELGGALRLTQTCLYCSRNRWR